MQAICTADRIFTNVAARWPGSTHDSRIFENSFIWDKFENGEICGWLLGNSGYPCKQYLMTSLLHPANDSKRACNCSHIKTRVRVEQAFEVLKQCFRCSLIPLRTGLNNSLPTIVPTMCFHNFALKRREQDRLDVEDDLQSTFQQPITTANIHCPHVRTRSSPSSASYFAVLLKRYTLLIFVVQLVCIGL